MIRPRFAILLIFIAACVLVLITRVAPAPRAVPVPAAPDTIRYSFPAHVSLLTAAASVALPVACLLFATSRGLLTRLFSLLPALLGLVLAGAAYDAAVSTVTIAPQSMTLPARGFPFRPMPTVSFAELSTVYLDGTEREIRLDKSDGTTVKIPTGDLVTAALPAIVRALDAHHVPYVTQY